MNHANNGPYQLLKKDPTTKIKAKTLKQLTLFRMDFFGAARGWEGPKSFPLPKIRHTYVTVMKLRIVIPYLRKIQKTYESCNSTLEFC